MLTNHILMMGALMAPAAEPTFNSNEQAASTRVKDYLEIAFQPTTQGGAVVFERIPLTTELAGFVPTRNVTRKDTYQEADGSEVSLVAVSGSGGNIQFMTASTAAMRNKLLAAANKGEPVLFKSHYDSAGVQVWGSARVVDRGIQGGRNDIPDWGFTLEIVKYQYVDKDGNAI